MLNIFVGVPQSKYAAMAILFALAAISVAILFGRDPVPMGQKFMFIVLMFVLALPGLLLTLFQLTCLVTGSGMKNQRWWCSAFAWIGTILILIYAAVLVVVAVMSIVNGTDITKDIAAMDSFANNKQAADQVAMEYFQADEKVAPPTVTDPMVMDVEEFEDDMVTPPAMDAAPEEPRTPAAPEAFAASELEPFNSCGAPFV